MNKPLRSGAIVITDDQIALIERCRVDAHYYVFPGGKVEPGESLEAAACREIAEELGWQVEIGALVAISRFNDNEQYFFLATITGGTFGTGDGAEILGDVEPSRGSYHPVLVPIDTLEDLPVRPRSLCRIILEAQNSGWPPEPVTIYD